MLFGNCVGYLYEVFHPVDILLKSHAFHLLGIVGIVVDCSHGAEAVEALDEHAFVVHVGEAQRSYNLVHALLLAPLYDGVEESVDNLVVIDKLHETEAEVLLAVAFVYLVVDDTGDASHGHVVAVGHE